MSKVDYVLRAVLRSKKPGMPVFSVVGNLRPAYLICPPALCVQMDLTRTFEANTKCNNINYV